MNEEQVVCNITPTEYELARLKEQFNAPDPDAKWVTEDPTIQEEPVLTQAQIEEYNDSLNSLRDIPLVASTPEILMAIDAKQTEDEDTFSRAEFEAVFNQLYEDAARAEYDERMRRHQVASSIGLDNLAALAEVEKFVDVEGADIFNNYVFIHYSDNKIINAEVLPRPLWEDGTPRRLLSDMPKYERDMYRHYVDLTAYHDDGAFNVELTAALYQDWIDRTIAKRQSKAVRVGRCLPSNPLGRNDKCPCGSGLKYKKCHLPKGGLVIPATLEQARKHFGDKFFDYEAPPNAQELEKEIIEGETSLQEAGK